MGSGTDGGMDNGMDDEAGGRWHDEAHGGADKLDVRRRRSVSAEYFGGRGCRTWLPDVVGGRGCRTWLPDMDRRASSLLKIRNKTGNRMGNKIGNKAGNETENVPLGNLMFCGKIEVVLGASRLLKQGCERA